MASKYGKHRGAETELKACAWLLEQGYEVFRNVSPHGHIDIVAIKDGVTRYIDVKSGNAAGTNGVETLRLLAVGGFRFTKARRKFVTREMTPREIVLSKLSTGLVDDGA